MSLRLVQLGFVLGLGVLTCVPLGCAGRSVRSPETHANLRLVDVSPRGEVSGEFTPIVLSFDRPAVDAAQVGRVLGRVPVVIAPALPVEARWVDRQRLVLAPLASPTPATRYELRLVGELARATDGAHAFVYAPLALHEVTGSDPELRWLDVRPVLVMHLSTDVQVDAVAERCALLDPGGARYALQVDAPAAEASALSVTPERALEPGMEYRLHCAGLETARGNTRAATLGPVPLRTRPPLSVRSLLPEGERVTPNELELSVALSTPVERETLLRHLHIEPKVEGFADAWVQRDETAYVAVLELDPATTYTLSLDAKLKDRFGQRLVAAQRTRFTTSDAAPALQLDTGIYAVEAQQKGYPLWTRNLDDYQLRCAQVPEAKLANVLVSELNYDPWYNVGAPDRVDFKALGGKARERTRPAAGPKNRWREEHVDLPALCGGGGSGARGVYLAEFANEAVRVQREARGWGRYPYRVLANVTDLGVLLKVGPRAGVVWVTSIASGAPIAGARVKLLDPRGKLVHTGRTEANGLLKLPGSDTLLPREAHAAPEGEDAYEWEYDAYRRQRLIAVVRHGDDLAVVDGNWQNGIQVWNFGFDSDRSAGPALRALIQSDRGVYRPGETVSFKGFVRELAAGTSPRVPETRRVKVRVEEPEGRAVFEAERVLSDFGGFDFAVELSEQAPLGDYRVRATLQGQSFDERFSVEEFRPIGFEIAARHEPEHFALGKRLKLGYTARYLFGAPLAGAQVQWQVMRRPRVLRFAGYEAYGFDDAGARDDFYAAWDEYGSDGTSFVGEGETTTDAQGRFGFVLRDPARGLDTAQDYLISASVRDASGQTVTRRAVVVGDPQEFYVGLHPQEWVQAVGMPFAVDAVAVDRDGKRRAASVELSYSRRVFDCRDTGEYRARIQCERRDTRLWSRPLTLEASGSNTTPIVPDAPGEYVIRIAGRDGAGRPVVASSTVWVIGKGEAFWSGDESARMSVVASRDSYAPGDTARLVPRADTRGAHMLVTLERDGVLDARVLGPDSSEQGIELDLDATHAPNVYASVALVRGRTGPGDAARPEFKLGMVELKVSAQSQRLDVRIETEREAYQPGEKVRGEVLVEQAGRAVDAELSLSVADEGVLQLVAYRTPDPMALFYAPHGLGVDTSTNLNRVARPNAPRGAEEDEAGGDGPGLEPKRVRSRFVRSALWLPALRTGDDGAVSFEFEAPDNLTAFRLMAVVADRAARFGSGEQRIRVDKPLLAQAVLPRFVRPGDEVELGAVLHNRTDVPQQVVATLALQGFAAQPALAPQRLTLPAGAQRAVRWRARAERVASARVELHARSKEYSDAFVQTLPIHQALVTEHRVLAQGRIAATGRYHVTWPADADLDRSTLEVTLDASGLSQLESGLRSLIEYPYGCLEQTLSRLIPLFALRELSATLQAKDFDGQAIERFVALGVNKVLRHQHPNGHFSLWPGAQPEPHLTAYALWGLSLARDAGVQVDMTPINAGLDALERATREQAAVLAPSAAQATAALVLARYGRPDHGLIARLYEARAALTFAGRAQLLEALGAARSDARWVEVLSAELLREAPALSSWPDAHGEGAELSSPVRDQAIVLRALLGVAADHPRVPDLVQSLLAARGPEGAWRTTQENVYALLALADYARRSVGHEARVQVELDEASLIDGRVAGSAVLRFSRSARALSGNALVLRSDRPLYAVVRQKVVRRLSDTSPLSRGFSVERRYVDPDSGAGLSAFAVGQLVRVELTVSAPAERAYVALIDPLPAGVEPVQTRFATEVEGGSLGSSAWDHVELRDDRSLGFVNRMGQGALRLHYLVRATAAGSFIAPAPEVEAMYRPELRARGRATHVEVTP